MFDQLERRAYGICGGILIAIVALGRMFGGSLWGLLPLSFCVASGVYLWMKEVVRSGKELEWSSEQLRGETVRSSILCLPHGPVLTACRPLPISCPNQWNG